MLAPSAAPVSDDAQFTLIEMRLDGRGRGEAKMSLGMGVVVDSAAKVLALDDYAAAQAQFKVTR
jgi:hypothetical protein